jgi:hypothetical protein
VKGDDRECLKTSTKGNNQQDHTRGQNTLLDIKWPQAKIAKKHKGALST